MREEQQEEEALADKPPRRTAKRSPSRSKHYGDPDQLPKLVQEAKQTPPPGPGIVTVAQVPEPKLQTLYNWLADVAPAYLSQVNWTRPRDFLPEKFQLLENPIVHGNWCFCETESDDDHKHTDICLTMQAAITLVRENFPRFAQNQGKIRTRDEMIPIWMSAVLDWIDGAIIPTEIPAPDWKHDFLGATMSPPHPTTRHEQYVPSGVYHLPEKPNSNLYLVENPKPCTVRSHLVDPNTRLKSQPAGETFEYCRVKEHRWRPDWAPFYPPSQDVFDEYGPLPVNTNREKTSTRMTKIATNGRRRGQPCDAPVLIPGRVPYRTLAREGALADLREASQQIRTDREVLDTTEREQAIADMAVMTNPETGDDEVFHTIPEDRTHIRFPSPRPPRRRHASSRDHVYPERIPRSSLSREEDSTTALQGSANSDSDYPRGEFNLQTQTREEQTQTGEEPTQTPRIPEDPIPHSISVVIPDTNPAARTASPPVDIYPPPVLMQPRNMPAELFKLAKRTMMETFNRDTIMKHCKEQLLCIYAFCRTQPEDTAERERLMKRILYPGCCILCLGGHPAQYCPTKRFTPKQYEDYLHCLWEVNIRPSAILEVHYQTRNNVTGTTCQTNHTKPEGCPLNMTPEHRQKAFLIIDGGVLAKIIADWDLFRAPDALEEDYKTTMDIYYLRPQVDGTPTRLRAAIHETADYWAKYTVMRLQCIRNIQPIAKLLGTPHDTDPARLKNRKEMIRTIQIQLQMIHELVTDEDLPYLTLNKRLDHLRYTFQREWFKPQQHAVLPDRAQTELEIVYQTFENTPWKTKRTNRFFRRLTMPIFDYGLLETVLTHPCSWQYEVVGSPFVRDKAYFSRLAPAGWSETGQRRLICLRGDDLDELKAINPDSQLPNYVTPMVTPRKEFWREQILDQLCQVHRYHSKAYEKTPAKTALLEHVIKPEICELCGTYWQGYKKFNNHRCKPNLSTVYPEEPITRKIWVEEDGPDTLCITDQKKKTTCYRILDGGHFKDTYNNNWGEYELLKASKVDLEQNTEAMRMRERDWFKIIKTVSVTEDPPFPAYKYPDPPKADNLWDLTETNTNWINRQHRLRTFNPRARGWDEVKNPALSWEVRQAQTLRERSQAEETPVSDICCFLLAKDSDQNTSPPPSPNSPRTPPKEEAEPERITFNTPPLSPDPEEVPSTEETQPRTITFNTPPLSPGPVAELSTTTPTEPMKIESIVASVATQWDEYALQAEEYFQEAERQQENSDQDQICLGGDKAQEVPPNPCEPTPEGLDIPMPKEEPMANKMDVDPSEEAELTSEQSQKEHLASTAAQPPKPVVEPLPLNIFLTAAEKAATPSVQVYFSDPDRIIVPELLPKYLEEIDMEALTYLWSKAAHEHLTSQFPDGLFPFPAAKYMYLLPVMTQLHCQFCSKTHLALTKSCLMDNFITHERTRMPITISFAPPEIKLKLLKDRFMRYQQSGYILDTEGADRVPDPDYSEVRKSLWETSLKGKAPSLWIDPLIDEAYELEPGFSGIRRGKIQWWNQQLAAYRSSLMDRKPQPWYKRKFTGRGKPYRIPASRTKYQ